MYCIECGKQIPDNSKFCPACGRKQNERETLINETIVKKIIDTGDSHISKSMSNKNILTKNELQFLIGWIAFHSFALLTSYGEVKGFNERGWYSAGIIWPFNTDWFFCKLGGGSMIVRSWEECVSYGGIKTFNGIFTGYDITDFLLYIGLSLFVILFVVINRKVAINKHV